MAKRKPVEKIQVDSALLVKENQPPLCYGNRESFCKKELCGKWFETCSSEAKDDQSD